MRCNVYEEGKGGKGEHTDMDGGWKGTPGGLSKEIPLGEVSGRLRGSLQMTQVSAPNRTITKHRG